MNIDNDIENEVCVCITNFNKALYIEEALNSVISQNFNGKLHIIIVDDCSNDNSKTIILNYQNKYPKLITAYFNNSNLGLIPNFIKISKLARGKYVAFLDSDDYWIDNFKIQKQVNLIQKEDSTGIIHTNYSTIRNNKILNEKASKIPSAYVFKDLIINNFITHSSVLIRKNLLIETIAKLEKLNWKNFYYNDYPIYLMISVQYKINYLDQKTTVYRNLESSASHTKDYDLKTKIIDSTFHSRMYFIENLKDVSNQTKNKIHSNYFYSKLLINANNAKTDNFFQLLFLFYKYNSNFKHLIGSFIIISKLLYLKLFNPSPIIKN